MTNWDILKEKVSEVNVNYSNKTYKNFMILVIKYRLSNTIENTIIRFFNKHANFDKSLLLNLTK